MDNPLSIVSAEGASNEFPVLKAFQEYIDAEQAKARKRMLGLSVFFIVLLFVVVVTFVLILTTVLNRNQSLSDRLLDYALREREKAPVVQQVPAQVVQPQPSADIVNTLVKRLEKEQLEMKTAFEKQRKEAEARAAAAERARSEELARMKAELAKEREKAQKESDRKAAIERHRRRLYPEYYGDGTGDDLKIPPPAATFRNSAAPSRPPQTVKPPPAAGLVPVTETRQAPKPRPAKASSPLSSLKPVTYFNTDDDDSVPFLLETPKQNK